MKAITIIQPFASLIAVGAKTFETRSWRGSSSLLGERIAIHAGMKFDDLSWAPADLRAEVRYALGDRWQRSVPRGAIVATATLADYVLTDRAGAQYPERIFGDWGPGRWAWRLIDVVAEEVPNVRGRQRVWEWEPGVQPDEVPGMVSEEGSTR